MGEEGKSSKLGFVEEMLMGEGSNLNDAEREAIETAIREALDRGDSPDEIADKILSED